MKRNIYSKLLEWKDKHDRKPLVLEGARQVGKTYILKQFGESEFRNMVYVNCDRNQFVQELFAQDYDVERIVRSLSAYTMQSIEAGKTLLFLDEVQEAPRVLSSLKYFCEDFRQLHVVVAGSLLGLVDHEDSSYPVGKVDELKMYPMTFEEFLGGLHRETMLDLLHSQDWKTIDSLREPFIELLRQYYFVGGMPEAVAKYRQEQDIPAVREIQKTILRNYSKDFSKHKNAARDIAKIRQVWASIPAQLARENKKFIFGAVKKGSRAKDFEAAIQWLVDAGLVYKICRNAKPIIPLSFYTDNDAFKLYMLDCGLMGAMSNTPPAAMLVGDRIFKEYKGAFTENYVLQQLVEVDDDPIYYYSKENSSMEIDFCMQRGTRVLPIEVKAEENVKAKSLYNYINVDHKDLHLKGIRFSMLPYRDQEWMENVPLYAVSSFINKL